MFNYFVRRFLLIIPTFLIATMVVCWTTFSRLDTVMKCGVSIHRTMHNAIKPDSVPNCRP